jgi:hypothetical protein
MKLTDVSPYPQKGQFWVVPNPLAVVRVDCPGSGLSDGLHSVTVWNPEDTFETSLIGMGDCIYLPYCWGLEVAQGVRVTAGDVWQDNSEGGHGELVVIGESESGVLHAYTQNPRHGMTLQVGHAFTLIQPGPKIKGRTYWDHLDEDDG